MARAWWWLLAGWSSIALACSERTEQPSGGAAPRCAENPALVMGTFTGTSLGPKQLALTFDDGHGSRTMELARYLESQGIRAGFFVNGMRLPDHLGVRQGLVAHGHVIGNHTQDHLDLTSTAAFPNSAAGNAALVDQLAETDALIAPFVPASRFMFRAPFGAWNARDQQVLSASAMDKYVGHIGWDIGGGRSETFGADWACWQDDPKLTTRACGDLYLNEIEAVGRGIVLMHDADYGDPSNHALDSGVGNTVDMVKYLVPCLKARGYTFVRVDEVPDIANVLPPLPVDPPPDAGAPDAATRDAGTPDEGTADAGSTSTDGGASSASRPDSPPAAGTTVVPAPDPCAPKDSVYQRAAH
ncbi:Nodulation protein B [Labilithrix luteola]|uniref:Nodulation protein B n=1 Tax=Labilithrix luteola TaxID=1391654 RepID=A0A0K1QE88_9BACT|nr:polysaccharide deacetylase family protein [Labilithrix luteola]AKV04043.1 Nodulation protein B [Labilithrix luteola]